jgi:hypothetical protein
MATAASMVVTVTTAKTPVTQKIPLTLCVAAGNMSRGINGSQGPKTKTTKMAQGVSDPEEGSSIGCV